MTAGLYIIKGPDGVYVGESSRIEQRHPAAWRAGLVTIVRRMPGATLRERRYAEADLAESLARGGAHIVSTISAPQKRHVPLGTSYCTKHHQYEPLSNFPPDARRWNGVTRQCLLAATRRGYYVIDGKVMKRFPTSALRNASAT